MQKHLCWFLLKRSPCLWLKVFKVIKWHTVPDGWPERRLGEETGALWLLCLLLHALTYFLTMVWQPPSPSLSHVHSIFSTVSRKESRRLIQDIFTLNAVQALTFHLPLYCIFLNQMNHQYVYIIMVSDHTNAQSLVQLTEHTHLL